MATLIPCQVSFPYYIISNVKITYFCLDLERKIYFTSLMPYLRYLHSVFQSWSEMSTKIQSTLVNYGAFHLMLNELHTAPTAQVCCILSVYYAL